MPLGDYWPGGLIERIPKRAVTRVARYGPAADADADTR